MSTLDAVLNKNAADLNKELEVSLSFYYQNKWRELPLLTAIGPTCDEGFQAKVSPIPST